MKSNELVQIGFPKEVAGVACREIGRLIGKGKVEYSDAATIARSILRETSAMADDFPETVAALRDYRSRPKFEPRDEPAPYEVWGREHIEDGAFDQIRASCSLPISVRGALMPDAHQGYGLPIGGVLATDNAVIPYAVGVDIACRMKLTVFDLGTNWLTERKGDLRAALLRETRFGMGCEFARSGRRQHRVMDDPDWNVLDILRLNRDVAWRQLGTSGGGNHFVEFGIFTSDKGSQRLALLSHSGSRGVGSKVALHYSGLAGNMHPELPDDLKHLAWLDLDSAEGIEYWLAMQLMGRYAQANHDCIHDTIRRNLGAKVVGSFENHHNFAWKEVHHGREVVVHRKGATPAHVGTVGIIPGSMSSPAYVVRGKGCPESLRSASHGAGRRMSRKRAKASFDWAEVKKHLKHKGVTLMSAGIDEAPGAYKNIDEVMGAQADLVEVIGRFDPKLVRMADD